MSCYQGKVAVVTGAGGTLCSAIAKDMAAKGATEDEIAAKLKYKPYAAKMRMIAASRFSKKELISFIDDTIKVQEKVRFGVMDENLALERLIIKYSMRLHADL